MMGWQNAGMGWTIFLGVLITVFLAILVVIGLRYLSGGTRPR